jgi:hypothetical protein
MEEGDEDDSDAEELLEGDEEDSVKLVVRVVDSLKERDIMLRFLRRGFMLVVVAVREDSNDLGRERERERERERGNEMIGSLFLLASRKEMRVE